MTLWILAIVAVVVLSGAVWYEIDKRKRLQIQSNGSTLPIDNSMTNSADETIISETGELTDDAESIGDGCPIIRVGTSSICGMRKNQQDALYCSEWKNRKNLASRGLLAAVADGIGGLDNGDLASVTVVQNIRASFLSENGNREPAEELLYAAAHAHKGVLELNREGKMCGSTLVSVLIKKWALWLLSVGDSRIALYRSGVLLTLNREHVMKRDNDEERAFEDAVIAYDPRREKALTSFMGKENLRQIDRTLSPMRLLPGDKIVLMSDGVFGTVSEDELCAALACSPEEAAIKVTALVEAKNRPGQDNASIIVIGISIA